MKIRLIFKLLQILIKDRIFYPDQLLVDLAALATRCGVLLVIYNYVFTVRGGELSGLTFPLAAWSIFFYFSFSSFRIRHLPAEVINDIKSGAIEVLFSKPISYILYRSIWQLGLGIFPFFVCTIIGLIPMIVFVGFPPQFYSIGFWIIWIITFIFCLILSTLIYLLVALTSFWLEDSNSIWMIVDKLIMTLGGSYLPVAFFPTFMVFFAKYSPFGATHFITHSLNSYWTNQWLLLLVVQFFWLLVLLFITIKVFSFAQRRLVINGG